MESDRISPLNFVAIGFERDKQSSASRTPKWEAVRIIVVLSISCKSQLSLKVTTVLLVLTELTARIIIVYSKFLAIPLAMPCSSSPLSTLLTSSSYYYTSLVSSSLSTLKTNTILK